MFKSKQWLSLFNELRINKRAMAQLTLSYFWKNLLGTLTEKLSLLFPSFQYSPLKLAVKSRNKYMYLITMIIIKMFFNCFLYDLFVSCLVKFMK